MRQAASSSKSTASRKRLLRSIVTAGMAVGAILVAAGPAFAQDAGTFVGGAAPRNDKPGDPSPPFLCAHLGPYSADPALNQALVEKLTLTGTLNGTATFTATSGSVNPVGSYTGGSGQPCFTGPVPNVPSAITGTLDVTATRLLGGPVSCSGDPATYLRVGTTIKITDTSTTSACAGLTFTGEEVACPAVGCPVTGADSVATGTYEKLT